MQSRRSLLQIALLAAFAGVTTATSCVAAIRSVDDVELTTTAQQSGTNALLIAVAAVNDSIAWASGARGTVIRTTDGGAHWTAMRVPGADSLQFRDIVAHDARTAWVLSIGNGEQSRIYRTDDGGANWRLQFKNTDPRAFYDCIEFWDRKHGIAIGDATGTEMAVLRTDDGGATWRRLPPSQLPVALEGEGSFAASGTCIVTSGYSAAWIIMNTPSTSRIIHTADYGRRWRVDTLPITTHEGSGAQSVLLGSGGLMVLGGGYATKPGDTLVALSGNEGKTWLTKRAPSFRVGTWGGAFVMLGTSPQVVVAVGPSGSAWSHDLGTTWTPLDTLNYWSVGFGSATGWAVGTQGRVTRINVRLRRSAR